LRFTWLLRSRFAVHIAADSCGLFGIVLTVAMLVCVAWSLPLLSLSLSLSGKGVFRRVENLGVRPLAHRMKAHMKYNEEGRFMRLFIQASPVLCRDIEQRLRIDDQIVKTMTIKHKQPAPVVVPKRVHNLKVMDSTSVTGILHHAPVLEYHVADVLMRFGLMREDDVLSLRRYKDDAGWDALRQERLLERARGGNAAAASVLQVPIPTRAEDLRDIARISAKEEAQIAAFDSYRRASAVRRAQEREDNKHSEEMAMRRRLAWYASEGQFIRHRALTKRLNKLREEGTKRMTVEQAVALQTERDMAKRAKIKAQFARTHENKQLNVEALQPDLTPEEQAREDALGSNASSSSLEDAAAADDLVEAAAFAREVGLDVDLDELADELDKHHHTVVAAVRRAQTKGSLEQLELLKAGMSAEEWSEVSAAAASLEPSEAEKATWAAEDAAEEANSVETKRATLSPEEFQTWLAERKAEEDAAEAEFEAQEAAEAAATKKKKE
jgi:ribosomal protein S6